MNDDSKTYVSYRRWTPGRTPVTTRTAVICPKCGQVGLRENTASRKRADPAGTRVWVGAVVHAETMIADNPNAGTYRTTVSDSDVCGVPEERMPLAEMLARAAVPA